MYFQGGSSVQLEIVMWREMSPILQNRPKACKYIFLQYHEETGRIRDTICYTHKQFVQPRYFLLFHLLPFHSGRIPSFKQSFLFSIYFFFFPSFWFFLPNQTLPASSSPQNKLISPFLQNRNSRNILVRKSVQTMCCLTPQAAKHHTAHSPLVGWKTKSEE